MLLPEANLEPNRRGFLAGLGLLVVAAHLPTALASISPHGTELNAFVAVAADGTITIAIPSSEMGQGVITSLPQLVADELDIQLDRVTVLHAPAKDAFRTKLALAKEQLTGGSMSVRVWNEPLRQAGATARQMLILAAAERWDVDPATCTTTNGTVQHTTKGSIDYTELAAAASRIRPPKHVPLRRPGTIAGISVPRQDLRAKVTGEAVFGIDIRVPGMLRASLRICPHFGGTVAAVDDTAARAVKGVHKVLVFDDFVAVVADGWWQAESAARLLEIAWQGGDQDLNNEHIEALFDAALSKKGRSGNKAGNVKRALQTNSIVGTYSVPYLDHAPIEPLNCTVHIDGDVCRIWTGTQVQTRTLKVAKDLSGCRTVNLQTPFLGGGFGRRGNVDFVETAVRVARHLDHPVQLIWPREQCTQHGFFRPGAKCRLQGSVDAGGIQGLRVQLSSENILYRYLPKLLVGAVGAAATFPLEGMRKGEFAYSVPNLSVEYSRAEIPVPVGFWRSVGHSHNGFFLESFIDELAHAAQVDPVAFRMQHLHEERYRRVLKTVAEKSGWGAPKSGRFQGVAIMESYGSVCAQVAEVEILAGRPKVHRVVVVVDCGEVVNPDIVQAQLMGAVCFGLSAAMGERLDLVNGAIVQSNFHDYPLLQMLDAPEVEGYSVRGPDSPIGGIGEVATPPVAPAVCNAIFAATGRRIRSLPILEHFR